HIWTRPFLLLFLGAAALCSLLVIFLLPAVVSWIALGAELALCLVGWWMVRARLLRAGLLLQALLVIVGFLSLLFGIRLQPGGGFVNLVVAELVLGITSLISVAVFLCLSYGIARWRAPLDAWLTILQVALTVGVYGFLMLRNFDLTDFFT